MRMRRFMFLVASVAVAVASTAGFARAGVDAGATSGALLRLGSGAKSPAMGDAGAGGSDGVAAIHYNPSGLAWSEGRQIAAMYQNLVLDIGMGEIGFALPFDDRSHWGASVRYLDYGKIPRVTVQDVINSSRSGATYGASDVVGALSYGRRLSDRIALGLTAKVLHEEIESASGTALAGDVGLSWRKEGFPIKFGVTVQNIGQSLKLESTGSDLPLLVRGGASADVFPDLTLSGDIVKVRDQDATFHFGGEYRWEDRLAFRIGYNSQIDADNGLTAGVGLHVDAFKVDYAFVPYGAFGNTHRVALRYDWGDEATMAETDERVEPARTEARRPEPVRSSAAAARPEPATKSAASAPVTSSPAKESRPAGTVAVVSSGRRAESAPARSSDRPTVQVAERRPEETRVAPSTQPARAASPQPSAQAPARTAATASARPAAPTRPGTERAASPAPPARTSGPRTIETVLKDAERAAARGDARGAEDFFEEAISIDPENTLALYNLATFRYLAGDFERASGLYRQVAYLKPNDVEAWLYYGLCERKLIRPRTARTAFLQVLDIDPDNEYAKRMLGRN